MQSVEIRKRLGESIKGFRESQGWSQTELAERLSAQLGKAVDPTTITRMERGSRPTSVEELYALSVTFSTSPTTLIPSVGVLNELAADYEIEAKHRYVEVSKLREKLNRATHLGQVSAMVRDAAKALLEATKTGRMDDVPGAVINLAAAMEKYGGFTREIPLVAALRELGVSDGVIQVAGDPAEGYLKFARRVLEVAFPQEWAAFNKETGRLETFAKGSAENET